MTFRRFEVLLRGLPDESLTVRNLGAVRPGQWHNVEELLAVLIETVFEGHRLLYSIHSKRGRRPPAPLKVPRPSSSSEQTPPKEQSSTEELLAFFGNPKNAIEVRYTPKEED